MGPNLYIFIHDAEQAEQVLKGRITLSKPTVYQAISDALGADGLFSSNGKLFHLKATEQNKGEEREREQKKKHERSKFVSSFERCVSIACYFTGLICSVFFCNFSFCENSFCSVDSCFIFIFRFPFSLCDADVGFFSFFFLVMSKTF